MADSSCTRDDRRERIVAECNAVRQALQDLLSEYMNNVSFLSDYAMARTHTKDADMHVANLHCFLFLYFHFLSSFKSNT